jgi:DNA-binding transcriptional LysR family regulator
MRFSHYDQVVQAALEGSGIAVGKLPHLIDHLRQGRLVAPFGRDWVAELGGFNLVYARAASGRKDVEDFATWLREEVRRDERPVPATAARGARSGMRRSSRSPVAT